jgi:hypothetical protein
MSSESCPTCESRLEQYSAPIWEPLLAVVGERLTEGFMWMHEERLADGTAVHAYKHIFTRRYLSLTADRRAFEPAPCRRLVPLRLDFAVERALCSWWMLYGWEDADVEALRDAVLRAQEAGATTLDW